MTAKQALAAASKKLQNSGITSAGLDAEVILSFVLKKPREFLYAHGEKKLTDKQRQAFSKLISRRTRHEPVAYLTGNKEFFGLRFKVNKNVLIPRPETELLVEEAIAYCQKPPRSQKPILVDVGTGSGCIAVALKKSLPQAQILALDISSKALKIASLNAEINKVKIEFFKSDLLKNVGNKKIDVIVANLPYLDDKEKNLRLEKNQQAHRHSLDFEPKLALAGGKFGLELSDKLFQQIKKMAHQPRAIFCEIGHAYPQETKKLAQKYFPDSKIEIKKDLAGLNRILEIVD
ncbi:MAG: peptide chain release factor N(5)-glutamine methyltransferase [Patescibacteria group bacterium]